MTIRLCSLCLSSLTTLHLPVRLIEGFQRVSPYACLEPAVASCSGNCHAAQGMAATQLYAREGREGSAEGNGEVGAVKVGSDWSCDEPIG